MPAYEQKRVHCILPGNGLVAGRDAGPKREAEKGTASVEKTQFGDHVSIKKGPMLVAVCRRKLVMSLTEEAVRSSGQGGCKRSSQNESRHTTAAHLVVALQSLALCVF